MLANKQLALVSCLLLGLLAGQSFAKPVPVFVWSKGQQLASDLEKRSARVSYESLPSAAVATELATGQASKLLKTNEPSPELVVLFVGSQMSVEEVAHSSEVEPLRATVEAAGSSVSLPHVDFKIGTNLASQVVTALEGQAANLHSLNGCDAREVTSVLRSLGGKVMSAASARDVVLVAACPTASLGQQAALAAAVSTELEGSQRPHVMAFAGDAEAMAGGAAASRRRSLQGFDLPAGVSAEDLAAASGLTPEQLQALAASQAAGQQQDVPTTQVDLSGLSTDDLAAAAAAAAAAQSQQQVPAGGSAPVTFVRADLQALPPPSPGPMPPIPPGVDPRTLPFNICPVGSQCQTQVRQFEIVILFITLIIALGVGTGMMHIVNTPSRFELPKDGVRSEN